MSFWWMRGIYSMDQQLYCGMVLGWIRSWVRCPVRLEIVRVMAAAWLISVMISAVGMVLASLIFYAAGEGQNRIRVSVYVVVVLAVLIGGIYAGHRIGYRRFLWGLALGALYYVTLCLISVAIRMYSCCRNGSSVCLLYCCVLAAGCWEECLDKRILKMVRQFFSWR